MNNEQKIKVESIVFKKLIDHLQNRTDVQNIDLMNLSGFCRNCLSRCSISFLKTIDSTFVFCSVFIRLPYLKISNNFF